MSSLRSPLFLDLVFGLPLHPLVVHLVVVLLPLAALGVLISVVMPKRTRPYRWLTLATLAVGVAGAFAAWLSGQALANRVGEPANHAQWGQVLPWVGLGLFVFAVFWAVAAGRTGETGSQVTFGLLATGTAVATIALTVIVGHSGAESVWGGLTPTPTPTTSPSATLPSPTATNPTTPGTLIPTPSATESPTTVPGFTLADLSTHNTAESCWVVIKTDVYDLTKWLPQHPGGASRILPYCGGDATSAFGRQHAGAPRPESTLAEYQIGTLS